jgi:uncharacterized membrane protein
MTVGNSVSTILRHRFFAGLAILVPIILTAKALFWLFTFLDGLAQPLSGMLFGRPIAGLGFFLTLAAVFVTGVIPLVGTVYGTTKKVLAGFGPQSPDGFKRFVFARLPGRTTPGFLTGTFTLKLNDGTTHEVCTVYVPTNHLYVGDIVVLPAADVLETDLTLEDGIGVILSGGASMPPTVRERES